MSHAQIERVRAILNSFNPAQEFWYDARIIVDDAGNVALVTYWRNTELAGTWEFYRKVHWSCMGKLLHQKLIENDGSGDPNVYTLSAKGRERLKGPK